MKRHNNLFTKIIEPENIVFAYNNAKKGKTSRKEVKRIEENKAEYLKDLYVSLRDKTFTTSNYDSKIIKEPKEREIFILPFYPDRIVQHALMNILEPIWDSIFIDDSYACRAGKGQHAASRRTMEFVRKYDYFLKADISKFYPSINQDIVFEIVKNKIKCKDTLWLLEDIIYSYPGNKNVPIGNYTSQWLGNLYMNELDHYIKHDLNVKGYVRYCDDFILFGNNKNKLKYYKDKIKEFLFEKLELEFSKSHIAPVKQGVDFVGYRHFPDKILLRKSTSKRMKKRLNVLPKQLNNNEITLEQYKSSIESMKGWIKHSQSFNFYNKRIKPLEVVIHERFSKNLE